MECRLGASESFNFGPSILDNVILNGWLPPRWINACDIRALVRVGVEASEGEIVFRASSSKFAGDHVVDLKRQVVEILGQLVLTSAACTLSNSLLNRPIQFAGGLLNGFPLPQQKARSRS